MIQGLYTAVQGMTPLMQKQDQIANNLANINTTGFKQSGLFIQSYHKSLENDQLQPFSQTEIKADEVYVDYSQGGAEHTGNSLDVMIRGNGFFTVMTPNGVRYSRNGNFLLDTNGFLVNNSGDKVMSKDGFIRLDGGKPVTITNTGEVIQDGTNRGYLKISDFKKPYKLVREGSSYFRPQMPDNPAKPALEFSLEQGFLESSNVNPIKNMVDMISSFKTYEADQKALLAQNETLDKAVNQVGRVG